MTDYILTDARGTTTLIRRSWKDVNPPLLNAAIFNESGRMALLAPLRVDVWERVGGPEGWKQRAPFEWPTDTLRA